MPELQNFPRGNQLESTDPNREFDCVAESIANSIGYLTRKAVRGDELKDAVYGRDYIGGTDAHRYVNLCVKYGVKLYPVAGDGITLIHATREHLAKGHPVLCTEPDPYVAASLGWSHVVAFYKWDEGTLTVMDPFGAHDVTKQDAEWAALFLFGEVWVLELLHPAEVPVVPPVPTRVPDGWHDDGATLTSPNGFVVIKGFRKWVLEHTGWEADDLPLENERRRDQLERGNPALGAGSLQRFRRTTLLYPDKWSRVVRQWTGQELLELERLLSAQAKPGSMPRALADQLSAIVRNMEHDRGELEQLISQNS